VFVTLFIDHGEIKTGYLFNLNKNETDSRFSLVIFLNALNDYLREPRRRYKVSTNTSTSEQVL